jgi:ABC-type ATPase involved in cell division/GNAT superfamily N-acetyltransferase
MRVLVNVKTRHRAPRTRDGARVAAMFGLREGQVAELYRDFAFTIATGEILVVIGPSGAGKSALLREAMAQAPRVRLLTTSAVAKSARPPVDRLAGGSLACRMETLSRCGLADAGAMATPARRLSGGQQYRLALAEALHEETRAADPGLIVADEFASCLDFVTAAGLCRNIRRLLKPGGPALLLATPREELLAPLRPDCVIVKPLGAPPKVYRRQAPGPRAAGPREATPREGGLRDSMLRDAEKQNQPAGGLPRFARRARPWDLRSRRPQPGTIRDYDELAAFHYMAGRPAAHKRVWVIRPPPAITEAGGPAVAAVLVVSPPLAAVRGRNLAIGGRYYRRGRSKGLALLNREMEWISRVIVHPAYRGCGLAVRLVRHALATAETPMVESLAAMGAINPFFERAGMTPWRLAPDPHARRLRKSAAAVGISARELAAVEPVRRLLRRQGSRKAAFLRREVDLCIIRMLGKKRAASLADPLAEACRRVGRQYIYYLWKRGDCNCHLKK